MSDLAFDNYCINCEKLCTTNSIYCSEECKTVDEKNTQNLNTQYFTSSHSPLLSPNYQNYNYNYSYSAENEDVDDYYIPLESIDEISLTSNNSNRGIISTSNNYKKWLTGTCI